MQPKNTPQNMVELWRGGMLEGVHAGHAVIWGRDGAVACWGAPETIIFPRSSCKMIQGLPLIETGAAERFGLSDRHLALACASHQGGAIHVDLARHWLDEIGLSEDDLRCGSHEPADKNERNRLIKADESPCQFHNNCSGKHCGFLSVVKHMGYDREYVELDHPLQKNIYEITQELCHEDIAGYGIDGCSAPNFAVSLYGLARAMYGFSVAKETGNARSRAMYRLRNAMASFPDLVAGKGRSCTELMQATEGRAVIKMGAEAVFAAIIPEKELGIAVKITDGGLRASDAVITALLAHIGVLDPHHPLAQKRLPATQKNWRGFEVGELRLAPGFFS